ncbi:MAG TPA: tetratricopeptide repeat protein [Polyangiaceae bacterium]|nr:tetratricopeptide repeat protein [Polyangiaceae bacterium]
MKSKIGRLTWGFWAITMLACSGGTEPAASPDPAPEPISDAPADAPAEPGGSSNSASPELKKAIDAIQAQDFAGAHKLLADLKVKEPKNAEVAFYSAVAAEGLGKADEAAKDYRQALELDGKLVDAAANLSALLITQSQYDAALKVIKDAQAHAGDHEGLLNNQAVALMEKGDAKGAAAAYEKLVAKRPDDAESKVLFAEALLRSGNEKRALEVAKSVVSSGDRDVLATAADLLAHMKAYDACVAALDKAIGLKDAAELRVRRGLCHHGKKDEAKALADFQKATQLEPKNAAAFYYLGQSHLAAKQKNEAKTAFKKATDIDPTGKVGKAAAKELAAIK